MTALPGGGVHLAPTPLGATRRTTTIAVAPYGDWATGQRVTAIGRDLTRGATGSVRTELDGFSFNVDSLGLIRPDGTGRGLPAELHGQPVQRGLRKNIAALRTDRRSAGSALLGPEGGLFDAMLDDVVGTSLASGYGMLYEGSSGRSGGQIASALGMTCVGFNTMNARGEEFDVEQYFERKPPSIEFVPADPLSWHQDLPMGPNSFRRRRMLQVAQSLGGCAEGVVAVTGYFRDTFMRPDGIEMVVHEYGLNATASGRPPTLDSVEAVPGNLPLDHCPLAARSALKLEGMLLAEVEAAVRREVAGPAACTHLNDGLRALRLVPNLLAAQA